MLTRRIVPCLDVRDGRVVKGVRFADLRDCGSPAEAAAAYVSQGADELVVLDVSATLEGRGATLATVSAVRAVCDVPVCVGGGVTCEQDAAELLSAGADKVAVNSAAVADPSLLSRLAARFGRQCVVLAVDARRRAEGPGWEVVVRSGSTGTDRDAVSWCTQGAALGAGEILLTSFDRDGTGDGYDLELLRAVRAAVDVPLVASGGVAGLDDLRAGLEAGADAVLAASIFHDGVLSVGQVKAGLSDGDWELRP